MDQLLFVLRLVNVPLAIVVFLAFFIRINDMWTRYGAGGRLLRIGILTLMAVAAYGSAESYVEHVPPAPRTAALTVALAFCLVGLVLIRRDPDQP